MKATTKQKVARAKKARYIAVANFLKVVQVLKLFSSSCFKIAIFGSGTRKFKCNFLESYLYKNTKVLDYFILLIFIYFHSINKSLRTQKF